ncbi:MAG: RluA family pseudouridine synthase [Rhodospirillales bacterium]|nr:MAG: RluA family pseudouridine synthase [Rhodospirillales bacterium]
MTPPLTVVIAEDKAGLRLDRVLADALPSVSRSRLKALIESGRVQDTSGDAVRAPSTRVRTGEIYAVDLPPPPDVRPAGQDIPLEVVFEDDHIIIVDKPAGLVVHPGAGNPERTLVNALINHTGGRLSSVGAPLRPGIVHRLDKNTSGLIVAAKTDAAHQGLIRQFAAHAIERAYFALVWGVPSPAAGRITGAIGRDRLHRTRMAVVPTAGKPAATDYRVLQVMGGGVAALLECRPITGRTHQIRVHLASIGHALIGDPVYGRRKPWPRELPEAAVGTLRSFRRQALHAFLIGCQHPVTGKSCRFQVPLDPEIRALVGCLQAIQIAPYTAVPR